MPKEWTNSLIKCSCIEEACIYRQKEKKEKKKGGGGANLKNCLGNYRFHRTLKTKYSPSAQYFITFLLCFILLFLTYRFIFLNMKTHKNCVVIKH